MARTQLAFVCLVLATAIRVQARCDLRSIFQTPDKDRFEILERSNFAKEDDKEASDGAAATPDSKSFANAQISLRFGESLKPSSLLMPRPCQVPPLPLPNPCQCKQPSCPCSNPVPLALLYAPSHLLQPMVQQNPCGWNNPNPCPCGNPYPCGCPNPNPCPCGNPYPCGCPNPNPCPCGNPYPCGCGHPLHTSVPLATQPLIPDKKPLSLLPPFIREPRPQIGDQDNEQTGLINTNAVINVATNNNQDISSVRNVNINPRPLKSLLVPTAVAAIAHKITNDKIERKIQELERSKDQLLEKLEKIEEDVKKQDRRPVIIKKPCSSEELKLNIVNKIDGLPPQTSNIKFVPLEVGHKPNNINRLVQQQLQAALVPYTGGQKILLSYPVFDRPPVEFEYTSSAMSAGSAMYADPTQTLVYKKPTVVSVVGPVKGTLSNLGINNRPSIVLEPTSGPCQLPAAPQPEQLVWTLVKKPAPACPVPACPCKEPIILPPIVC